MPIDYNYVTNFRRRTLVVADIIVLLIEALKGIGANRQQAHTGSH